MKEKYYITTAIAYASKKPHIGNTYEVILTDAIARYKRMQGYDVFFLTGTDEHGIKIEELAKEKGISPKAYVDDISSQIRGIWDKVGASYDKFIRTTDDYHEKAVANIFKKLYDQGDIYKGKYEGLYCIPCETFFTETQAPDGKCPDCGRPLQKTSEEAYFLRLSKYQDRLVEHIEKHPDFIQPEQRKKEMLNNFILPGIQDLCVSRSTFKWGIPVTFDDRHVIYVWIDALSNYITALGYDVDEQKENYKKYWPADVHIIGKDILRFHTIIWPIILMALGQPLPKQVFGHGWLNFGNDKMSKSKGNVIYADELADIIGVDGVRYYTLSQMPFAADGAITYESVVEFFNSDLANNLGNLVSRTLSMTKKYFGGVIPQPEEDQTEEDLSLKQTCIDAFKQYTEQMDTFHIADAISTIFSIFKRSNKYIDETTPWVLAKSEESKGRLKTVIYNLLEAIRFGSIMLAPILPETSSSILNSLSTDKIDFSTLDRFGSLASGNEVKDLPILFSRLDLNEFMEKIHSLSAPAQKEDTKEDIPEGLAKINIDQFMNVELRTAQIIECHPVPKSDKLLCLQLDLGYERRQVVSGIAKFYSQEKLIGKKVIVVANLEPVKLRGVESNGMILASGEETVRVIFLDPETPNGERVR